MKPVSELTLWICLAVTSSLSWATHVFWPFSGRLNFRVQDVFAVVSFAIAIWIIRMARGKVLTISGAIVLLLIGQLWFLARLATFAMWSIGGFV